MILEDELIIFMVTWNFGMNRKRGIANNAEVIHFTQMHGAGAERPFMGSSEIVSTRV